jgi:hypothetical protein
MLLPVNFSDFSVSPRKYSFVFPLVWRKFACKRSTKYTRDPEAVIWCLLLFSTLSFPRRFLFEPLSNFFPQDRVKIELSAT